jgi:hypothetical protein
MTTVRLFWNIHKIGIANSFVKRIFTQADILSLGQYSLSLTALRMIQELVQDKKHDENRQGESYAPFTGDTNRYQRRFYIESYGCQMNFSDSEIVASILYEEGYGATRNYEEADLILLNTCSIAKKPSKLSESDCRNLKS